MALQPMKFRKKVVLAKVETVYGQDAGPTGTENAIQLSDVTITPMEAQMIERGIVRPTLGAEGSIAVGIHVVLEFAVEVAGSGTAGAVPPWGVLMRGCGMAEVIEPDTEVRYLPVSDGEESVSILFNIDGNKHALLGARGNFTLDLEAPGLPRFRFRFVGLWSDPISAPMPSIDLSAWQAAMAVSNA
ncbi:phage tail tube protein, partial [Telmatospirillum sp. J64-1]|uniref:phage tail tube protein n=1 Tax=Telmatospirillum sp. J64-1 TaxID=2502183 RepID=UPI001C8F5459